MLFAHFNFDAVRHDNAESLFRAEPPVANDNVFADLKLPGASDGDAIQWLQLLQNNLFIVAVSGQSQAVIQSELAGMEVTAVLRKPLDQEVILGELYRIGSDALLRSVVRRV